MRDFFSMTSAEIDIAAERHYDRMLARWEAEMEAPDAWEILKPDWQDIADFIDGYKPADICGFVRDYTEGDGDFMDEVYKAGLLDPYIAPEDEWKRKDPDDAWRLVDATFEAQWYNDDLFMAIYKWMPENHLQIMAQRLLDNADDNCIRDEYNKSHRDCFSDWED